MLNRLQKIIIISVICIAILPFSLENVFSRKNELPKLIKIYDNGIRAVATNGATSYYYEAKNGNISLLSQNIIDAHKNLIKTGEVELILEAKVKQYGSSSKNINFFVGGYSPTAGRVAGDSWNTNQLSDKDVKKAMNNKDGIVFIVSYDTHRDYGGPGSSFDSSLQGAFKNLMNQAEYELKNSGVDNSNTTITSYSTGHYLAMDYLTDLNRTEFNITQYNAVAPNLRGSELAEKFQRFSAEEAYYDMVPNNPYISILNSNPYFRDGVDVNVYLTTQDFGQGPTAIVYYSDEKDPDAKAKDIIDSALWQIKNGKLRLFIPGATNHFNPDKIFAMFDSGELPYYYKDDGGQIAYFDTKVLLEYKRNQLALQRNMKRAALAKSLKGAPCGAKTQEMRVLTTEINSLDQQIANIDTQLYILRHD